MKIGLIDVDGHNFPNLALMKISAFHKSKGDTVYVLTTDSLEGIEETVVNRICIKKNRIILNADCQHDDWGRAAWELKPSDFGKTVHLTREAAEQALEGHSSQ